MFAECHLLRSGWLLALLPLGWLLWQQHSRAEGAEAWRAVVDAHLLPALLGGTVSARRWLRVLALGWVLVVIALAGPTCQRLEQPLFDVDRARLVLLDLSPSMLAADVTPSRLARARFELQDVLAAIDEGQVGLVVFGPEPYVVTPLTRDAHTIDVQVPLLAPDLLPVSGERRTDAALIEAGRLLARAEAQQAEILLITDGLNPQATTRARARALHADGHRLSVLAVGSAQGAPVPNPDGGFMTDDSGAVVFSRLDREGLRALAQAGGGLYQEVRVDTSDTRRWLALQPASITINAQEALRADRWREAGPWLLLLVLPLAALAFRRGSPLLVVALMVIGLLPSAPVLAWGWQELWWRADQRGAQALAAGEPEQAAAHFRDPAWRAAAQARAGDYDAALEALAGVEGAEAAYNRGNALARLGQLDAAEAAYEEALRLDPAHADARHNLELVRAAPRERDPREQDGEQGNQHDDSQQEGNQQGQKQQNPADQHDAAGQSGPSETGQGEASAPQSEPSPGANRSARQPEETRADAESANAQGAEAGDATQNASLDAERDNLPHPFDDAPDAAELSSGLQTRAPEQTGEESTPAEAALSAEAREREQALDAQLRRLPDDLDPATLLRQRFLLQQLRREGQWP